MFRRVVVQTVLLILLAATLSSADRLVVLITAVIGLGALLLSRLARPEQFSIICVAGCGLMVPLVPWIGEELLLALGLVCLLIAHSQRPDRIASVYWSAPLITYGLGSVVGELFIAGDLLNLAENGFIRGVRVDGYRRVIDVWRALVETHLSSLSWCARMILFCAAVDSLGSSSERRRYFLVGLFYGSTGLAVFTLAQWLGLLPFTLGNQTPLWTSLKRISGLVSDPNALGLLMALSLWGAAWWVFEFSREIKPRHSIWALLVLCTGVVSGSRSFLLGVTLLAASLVWQSSRRLFVLAAGVGCFVVSGVTMLDTYTSVLGALQRFDFIPQGIIRGVHSLSLLRVSDTFGSRTLFFDIARKLSEGHVAFGIGADRFGDYVPLIGVTSGIIRRWTDNSNNLYLGIAVELGVIGLFLFGWAVRCRTRTSLGRRALPSAILGALALIMLTGPHIDFPEVALVVAFFLGAGTTQRGVGMRVYWFSVVLAALAGMCAAFVREQGVFPWHDSNTIAQRWLSNRARVELGCQPTQSGEHMLRTIILRPRYIPQHGPLSVRILEGERTVKELLFTQQEAQEVTIPCDSAESRELFAVITTPPWSPYRAWPESSGDRRLLGVEQVVRAQ